MRFALGELDASPIPPLDEALRRAKRVVSPGTGIVRRVVLEQPPVDGPSAYVARTEQADSACTLGVTALNQGAAASCDRSRAVMKAVGESIERYCGGARSGEIVATARDLAGAVAPERFELFAAQQFETADFPFEPFDERSTIRWVEGTSLSTGEARYLPACMVYVPYDTAESEPRICDRISTGLACAHSRTVALSKGILEVVERDALMITWHNRLPAPRVALGSIDDPFVRANLDTFAGMAVRIDAYCVTMDVQVPVILAVARSLVDEVPHCVLGLGTAPDPARAVGLALEEVALGLWGVRVSAAYFDGDMDFESLDSRGVAYAMRRELASNLEFLHGGVEVALADLPRVESVDPRKELLALTACLTAQGLEPIGCDLTTEDIDDVGFKVCRVVVPGMRPLDIKHSRRHLGGGRLYDVPVNLGRLARPHRIDELNQDPHPFP